jgi:hypothetical protein
MAEAVPLPIKIKVKSVGQECPTPTGNPSTRVKNVECTFTRAIPAAPGGSREKLSPHFHDYGYCFSSGSDFDFANERT